jgi:hypothetical protein
MMADHGTVTAIPKEDGFAAILLDIHSGVFLGEALVVDEVQIHPTVPTTGQIWPRGNYFGSGSEDGGGESPSEGIIVVGAGTSSSTDPPITTGQGTLKNMVVGYEKLQPDDVVFFAAFNNNANIGSLVGTNASGLTVFSDWKGAACGWVRFGSADAGNYGYTNAPFGSIWFVLRGLTNPATPVYSSQSNSFYDGAINLPAVTPPPGGGSLLLLQFVSQSNRDAALTSMTPALAYMGVGPTPTPHLGAWITEPVSSPTTIRMYPDGTGGGSGDSWAAVLALNGNWQV